MTAEEPEHTRKASSRLGICTHLLADHVKKGLRLRCARLHAILGDHEPQVWNVLLHRKVDLGTLDSKPCLDKPVKDHADVPQVVVERTRSRDNHII